MNDESTPAELIGSSAAASQRSEDKVVDQIGIYQTVQHPFHQWLWRRRYSVRIAQPCAYMDKLHSQTFWRMIHAQLAAGDLFTAQRRGYWEYRDKWHPVGSKLNQPRGLSAAEAAYQR